MAHKFWPGIAETTTSEGAGDITPGGRIYGALGTFFDALDDGDTCDYVIECGDLREEGLMTRAAGVLQRTTVDYARHANGDKNQTRVSFPAGLKRVYMVVRARRIEAFVDALRVQSYTQAERDRATQNLGLPKSGDKAICPQASAWIGWTKDNSQHDAALRIVTDNSGGDTGGSVNFSTLHARTATDPYTITQPNLPDVTLTTNITDSRVWYVNVYAANNDQKQGNPGSGSPAFTLTQYPVTVSGTISGSTSLGGSGTPFSVPIDMRVKYRNVILVAKD